MKIDVPKKDITPLWQLLTGIRDAGLEEPNSLWAIMRVIKQLESARAVASDPVAKPRKPLCECKRCGKQLYTDSIGNFEIDCGKEPDVMTGVCYACLRPVVS